MKNIWCFRKRKLKTLVDIQLEIALHVAKIIKKRIQKRNAVNQNDQRRNLLKKEINVLFFY